MKKFILALGIALAATSAYAFCTNYTIMGADGRVIFCNKCCTPDGNCQVYCN